MTQIVTKTSAKKLFHKLGEFRLAIKVQRYISNISIFVSTNNALLLFLGDYLTTEMSDIVLTTYGVKLALSRTPQKKPPHY